MKVLLSPDVINHKREIASRLESIRKDQDLTQKELGDLLGVTSNMVYRAETDLNISTDALLYIANFFIKNYRVNVEYIFAESTKGVLKYTTDLKNAKRLSEGDNQKRSDLLKKLIKELQQENLLEGL